MFTYFNYNLLMSNIIPYAYEHLNTSLDTWHVHTIFDNVPSTNTYLKEEAHFLSDRTIVLANQQSSGRGRYDRQFKSSRDKGIYCSFLLKNVKTSQLTPLSFACALALALSIHELYQIKVQIKWPNDLLLNKKKLAGILIETIHQADAMDVVIGFGLNVYHQDFEDLYATSLEETYPGTLDRNQFLIHFFKHFDVRLNQNDLLPLYREWMVPSGEVITTSIQGIKTEVTVLDILENGTLSVRKDDGSSLSLFNEEIQIISNL